MKKEARAELEEAMLAVQIADQTLAFNIDLMRRFLAECDNMDSVGHIVDPTLFRDPERRAVSAFVKPLFRAAIDFHAAVGLARTAAADALARVNAHA